MDKPLIGRITFESGSEKKLRLHLDDMLPLSEDLLREDDREQRKRTKAPVLYPFKLLVDALEILAGHGYDLGPNSPLESMTVKEVIDLAQSLKK